MEKFNESLWFDKRMWAQDIRGSVAYAKAIGKVGIITDEEVALLVKGLGDVHKEWEEGKFEIKAGDEGRCKGWIVLCSLFFSIGFDIISLLKNSSFIQFFPTIIRHPYRKRATTH